MFGHILPTGFRQRQRQNSISRLSSDSRYYTDGSNIDDTFVFELDKSSAMRSTGLPMKKLLVEEISKENEPKKRKPGVIARLMGLEGLPSPRHVHRPQKRSPDFSLQKNNSVACKLRSQLLAGQFSRGSSIDQQQEFKDVYEDLEASHFINHRCSSKLRTRSILAEPDMFLIQQKFLDFEKISTDEKLQDLEGLDFEKDLLPKFPKQLEDLKHSNGLQVGSYGTRIAVLSPLSSESFENNVRPWRAERQTSHKPHSSSQLNREDDLLLEPNNRHRASPSQSSPRFLLEEGNEENVLPTRIVVLKPNLGNLGSAVTPYQCNHQKGSWSRKCSPHDMGLRRPMSRKAREIARLVTVRMRQGLDETADLKSTAYRGYIGDESSYESNDSDADSSDSELYKLPYRKSFNESDFYGYSSSFGDSSVSKEAKRRLCDRWKMAHRYQNLDIKEGSTLAEMLALSDRDPRPTKSTAKTSLGEEGNRLGSYNGPAKKGVPLGISSRDGWKSNMTLTLPRSRSLPLSSCGISHGKCIHQGLSSEKMPRLPSDTECCSRNKAMKENVNGKEDFLCKNSSFNGKKRHSRHGLSYDEIGSSTRTNSESQVELAPANMYEQLCAIRTSSVADKRKLPKHGSVISSPTSSDIPSKQSSDRHKNTLPRDKNSILQEEADHPSPVSVLEVPCQEETSSYESFERVSAELHELRKHLQLLKLESGTFSEASTSTLFPIEEETTHSSPSFSEQDNLGLESECWQTSYAIDVLMGSGLEESDFSLCGRNWHYPDNPLDPKLFDNLEKKYKYGTTETKSERKLLFDRLNASLWDIFEDHVDCFPWVKPRLGGSKWESDVVRDAIDRLISQDFSNWESPEREVDKEMHWAEDGKEEIDLIGSNIEKVLIDEIVSEIIFN